MWCLGCMLLIRQQWLIKNQVLPFSFVFKTYNKIWLRHQFAKHHTIIEFNLDRLNLDNTKVRICEILKSLNLWDNQPDMRRVRFMAGICKANVAQVSLKKWEASRRWKKGDACKYLPFVVRQSRIPKVWAGGVLEGGGVGVASPFLGLFCPPIYRPGAQTHVTGSEVACLSPPPPPSLSPLSSLPRSGLWPDLGWPSPSQCLGVCWPRQDL